MAKSGKSEGQIQADILAAIGSMHGVQVMRINTGVFMDDEGNRRIRSVPKGTPDILCCVQMSIMRRDQMDSGHMRVEIPQYYTFGQMVWMEIKTPDKQLTVDQEAHFNAWGATGAICVRVTSPEQAVEFLRDIADRINVTRALPKNATGID